MTYTIYSADAANGIEGEDSIKEFGDKYAEAVGAALAAAGLSVEVEVKHNVTGYGSGLSGCDDDATAEQVEAIAGKIWVGMLEAITA